MNTGQPTKDDADLVNQNQEVSSQNNSPAPVPLDSVMPKTTPPPPVTPAPPPPPPAPSPPTPPPASSNIPLQQPSDSNLGVGTPNIGVEENPAPASKPIVPPPPPAPPMPSPPPPAPKVKPDEDEFKMAEVKEEDKIEAADSNGSPAVPPPPPSPPMPTPPPASMPQTPPLPKPPAPESQVQVKNYQSPQNSAQNSTVPQPPIKASSNSGFVVGVIMAILLGSAGGFFGFRYFDSVKTLASTEETPGTTASPNLDVSTWEIYNSLIYKFSVKYPKGWFISTTNPDAEEIAIASNQESLSDEPTGFKIEINFQESNGKTLKSWVEANSVAIGETKKAKEITVSDETAYQQELTKSGRSVATYIERPSKIMIVTYSAPDNLFGEGGEWYNNLINSIELL